MEAKLIGKFDIAAAGGEKGLLGDIDGDGRMGGSICTGGQRH